MTTTSTPHAAVVALPAKAMTAEDWEPEGDGRFYRYCEGETRDIPTDSTYSPHIIGVYTHAKQYDDGSIDDGATEAPGISLDAGDETGHRMRPDTGIWLSSAAARRLADVLVTAADELDGWSAR